MAAAMARVKQKNRGRVHKSEAMEEWHLLGREKLFAAAGNGDLRTLQHLVEVSAGPVVAGFRNSVYSANLAHAGVIFTDTQSPHPSAIFFLLLSLCFWFFLLSPAHTRTHAAHKPTRRARNST